MNSRIYSVMPTEDGVEDEARLVEATSAAQALRFVASLNYIVEVANPKTVAKMMADGVKLHDATKDVAQATLRG